MVKTNRERLKEIASVLASYGFGHIYNTRIRSRNKEQDAKNLRKAFEELGPSFIKIGQIISTRRDLLPSNYIQELSKLRDDAPPFSYNEMRRIFEKDLGLSKMDPIEWTLKKVPSIGSIFVYLYRKI
ncbi:hypothetical protein ACEN30_10225 [Marinilactibacillus psychrotolerans]|uniref:hypothetical protein n=1 Tax=Marinilactibacillus psychrotolerans TaxID=191770 RepID=UPI00388711F2